VIPGRCRIGCRCRNRSISIWVILTSVFDFLHLDRIRIYHTVSTISHPPGVMLPVIKPDNSAWHTWRKLPNPPTLMELTVKVNLFNSAVQANCERLMYQYVEINSELQDPATGIIQEAFIEVRRGVWGGECTLTTPLSTLTLHPSLTTSNHPHLSHPHTTRTRI
jgi:hypothetical protein